MVRQRVAGRLFAVAALISALLVVLWGAAPAGAAQL
jgi:hypothetical protein